MLTDYYKDELNEKKEKVSDYINSEKYIPLKFAELMTVLNVPSDNEEDLRTVLDALLSEGRIYRTKNKRYAAPPKDEKTVLGVLKCSAGGYFGFVSAADGGEIYIPGASLNGAIHNDTVLAGIDRAANGFKNARAEGHIIRVIRRGTDTVTGTVYEGKRGDLLVRPDNVRIYAHIKTEYENREEVIGKRVGVKITDFTKREYIMGEITEILGDKDSVKSYIDGIISESGIKTEFDDETLTEAENIPSEISEDDLKNRLDLRDELIFTIDGKNARDFDDAVSLKILDNSNYMLGVHIADVSHYVKLNTPLDKEAYSRATSVYLADRVIPMLPERLSNGICSLNPDEDRLTFSVFMEIDKNGVIVKSEIRESVIRSKERMTYEDINAIFDGDTELHKKYPHLLTTLYNMAKLADILNKKRSSRGAIQFDFPETSITADENSEPVSISYSIRGTSNKMIEEFMLAANETVAEFAYWAEIPFIYRAHEAPSDEKLAAFNEFIGNFGLKLKGSMSPVHPKSLQQILDKVKGSPEENMIADTMLRSLMKADYRDECAGHFGLAAKYYCHFTSPIRRYPDLAVHRILKEYLKCGTDKMPQFLGFVKSASSRSTEREITAETVERDVRDLMKTRYMTEFVGDSFEGVVTSVTAFGMFVTLENSVEGLVRLENLTDDYYVFNELTKTLTGKQSERVFKIGDRVNVVLMRSDIRLRQIDFVLSDMADETMFRKFEKKTAEKNTQLPNRQQRRRKHNPRRKTNNYKRRRKNEK